MGQLEDMEQDIISLSRRLETFEERLDKFTEGEWKKFNEAEDRREHRKYLKNLEKFKKKMDRIRHNPKPND